MDLQEELSQKARDPELVEREKKQEADRLARAAAEDIALKISTELKRQLVENVQQGKYTREYNKGTVTSGYFFSLNRYLKLDSDSRYEKRNGIKVRTALFYRFLVKPELAREYEYLRQFLDEWASENKVQVKWGITVTTNDAPPTNVFLLYPFPHKDFEEVPLHSFRRYYVSVQAVSCFPLDPSLPTEHMTQEDIRDKRKKIQTRIEHLERSYRNERGTQIALLVTALISLLGFLYMWYAALFWFSDTQSISCILISLLPGAVSFAFAYTSGDYSKSAQRSKDLIKEAEEELAALNS